MCHNWVIFTIITISCFSLFREKMWSDFFKRGSMNSVRPKVQSEREIDNSKNDNLWCNQIEACVNLINISRSLSWISHTPKTTAFKSAVTPLSHTINFYEHILYYFECNRWFDFTLFAKYWTSVRVLFMVSCF